MALQRRNGHGRRRDDQPSTTRIRHGTSQVQQFRAVLEELRSVRAPQLIPSPAFRCFSVYFTCSTAGALSVALFGQRSFREAASHS